MSDIQSEIKISELFHNTFLIFTIILKAPPSADSDLIAAFKALKIVND